MESAAERLRTRHDQLFAAATPDSPGGKADAAFDVDCGRSRSGLPNLFTSPASRAMRGAQDKRPHHRLRTFNGAGMAIANPIFPDRHSGGRHRCHSALYEAVCLRGTENLREAPNSWRGPEDAPLVGGMALTSVPVPSADSRWGSGPASLTAGCHAGRPAHPGRRRLGRASAAWPQPWGGGMSSDERGSLRLYMTRALTWLPSDRSAFANFSTSRTNRDLSRPSLQPVYMSRARKRASKHPAWIAELSWDLQAAIWRSSTTQNGWPTFDRVNRMT